MNPKPVIGQYISVPVNFPGRRKKENTKHKDIQEICTLLTHTTTASMYKTGEEKKSHFST